MTGFSVRHPYRFGSAQVPTRFSPVAVGALLLMIGMALGDLWLSSIKLGPIAPRLYIQAALFTVTVACVLIRTRAVGSLFAPSPFWKAVGLMLAWICAVNLVVFVTATDADAMNLAGIQFVGGRVVAGVAVGWLVSAWARDSARRQRALAVSILTAITVSAGVACAQWLRIEAAWDLATWFGRSLSFDMVRLDYKAIVRPIGLAASPIALSYQLALAAPLVFAGASTTRQSLRPFAWVVFLVMLIALIVNGTKSAVLGAGAGCCIVLWKLGAATGWRRFTATVLLGVVTTGVVLMVPEESGGSALTRFRSLGAESDQTRIAMLAGTWVVVSRSPLGVGVGARQAELASTQVELAELEGSEVLERTTVHNQAADVLMTYGLPGLMLLLAFYWQLWRVYQRGAVAARRPSALRLGLGAGIVAYVLNSLAHTGGPFTGDIVVWYFIGLLVAQAHTRERGRRRGGRLHAGSHWYGRGDPAPVGRS